MVEILVALAIIGVLSAVLITNLNAMHKRANRAQLAETMVTLAQALREFDRQVGVYPSELLPLSQKPTVATKDICDNAFTQAMVNKWAGPYIDHPITAAGIFLREDTVFNDIDRDPPTPATLSQVALLQIYTRGVDQEEALALDRTLDGDGLLSEGTIQWTVFPGFPRLLFSIPISGC